MRALPQNYKYNEGIMKMLHLKKKLVHEMTSFELMNHKINTGHTCGQYANW